MRTVLIRGCAAGVVMALSLGLAGCGGSSGSTDERSPRTAAEGAPAMSQPEAVAFWKRYDELNNAAMKHAGPPTYDGRAYSGVDTGFVLSRDVYEARLDKAEKNEAGTPFTTIAEQVYSPSKASRFVLALSSAKDYPKDGTSVSSLVRSGSSWKKEMSFDVRRRVLPAALAPGRASTATSHDVAHARTVVTSIVDYYRTGQPPQGFELGSLRKLDPVKYDGPSAKAVRQQVTSAALTRDADGEVVRVVKVRGGLLVAFAWDVVEVASVRPGRGLDSVGLNGDSAKVFGRTEGQRVTATQLASALVLLPDSGRGTLLQWKDVVGDIRVD